MSTFKTQVEQIIGITVTDTDALDDYLTASAREVSDILPEEVLLHNSTLVESATTLPVAQTRVFAVSRDGISCMEIPFGMSAQANDSDSLYKATDRVPMYYYDNNYLTILPSPSVTEKAQLIGFEYPEVAYDDTKIQFFPNNAVYAVITNASCSVLMNLMSVAREAIPSALNISDLSITVSFPLAPSLSAQSVSFSETAPSYLKPTQTFDVTQLESFLEDNEDSELAQIQVGRLQHELGEYQADIQNELNKFNQETAEYQALLQVAIQDAQLTSSDDAQKLQLYSTEVQDYQAQVGKVVQEYQSNLAKETQELGSNIQRIQAQLQALGSQYQLLQTRYQSELQRLSGVSKHGGQV